MSFLELKDIHKSYYVNKEPFPVLKGISLKFERGEFVSILGESGGGKSTLMNIIGGLDHNYEGDVLLNGKSMHSAKEQAMDAYRRQTIGFIFQSFNLISHLTLLDNVMVSLEMTNMTHHEQVERATSLLKQVGLEDHIHKYPNQISGGQKQRVAIARALASDPDVIIADEPTGALDSQNTKEILELMDGIAESGKLVICVTHSQDVANHGTRIVHMEDGKINEDRELKDPFPIEGKQLSTKTKHLSFRSTLKMSLQHMRYNTKRNLLIVFGGSIGIFSVILMLALGNGVKGYMNNQIMDQINPTTIQVAQKTDKQTAEAVEMKPSDRDRLAKVKGVKEAILGTYVPNGVQVDYNGKTQQIQQFQTWNKTEKESDIKTGSKPGDKEILLTKRNAKKISKDYKSLVGKTVTLSVTAMDDNNQPVAMTQKLKVSGIINSGTDAMSFDNLKSMYAAKGAKLRANFVAVSTKDVQTTKTVQNKIKALKTNGKTAYAITGVGSILDTLNTYISLAFYVLAGIAAISLLVSAIMIIVVLYISVSERTKEIGVLRALGVRRRDIRNLFVSEAFFIGLFSAILGIVLAWIVQLLINHGINGLIHYSIIQMTPGYIIFGLLASIIISLLAALAPSHQAAKLDPIESLAVE
ncbi:MAG: ATP-binding cassette domain-containing protein [Furfurilactobacillus sp.]|jgi:ABC-type lipoprotein export system ATPase subunit/ABC-type lipoprotein release transport system permease subunit|uniref:ATP-binding cassette domain-containing protein n=1 Tax=Furfurilactobacillus milii TaxID=2888272 RepID=A0ABT6D857_9LACO|nr:MULTISPECIES: ABC transporter ATP-binding protein/permease [Furfurilactobacillus]QLE65732.1 drug ABC exporter ATP-binding and membrane-spanning-permease subunits [Furfurilactobacillus rossiae]MCF6160357.1 ATP-binding cassette domain-containing protein [Furfurilactobacillus milii]MCF6162300.1 ATP-binding cassette domain-containing protein [Furfurilactobacillus milii]MCF6420087.1 ATP-binding cassette domain-containing protein [Furfurilactobacillus milii]MCH4012255.1 ATP-binding cassette domai